MGARSTPTSPNFAFLQPHDGLLVALGAQAERYFADDPSTSLIKLRQFAEVLARRVAANVGLYTSSDETQLDLLHRLRDAGVLTTEVRSIFHELRRLGNAATHDARGTHSDALAALRLGRSFGAPKTWSPGPFIPPSDPADESRALATELERLRKELSDAKLSAEAARAAAEEEARRRLSIEERARRDAEDREVWQGLAEEAERKLNTALTAAQAQAAAKPPELLHALTALAAEAGENLDLDEAETRRLIDGQLRLAGWEADTVSLSWAAGTRPQKGRDLAIAEWPTANGPADYVLFSGFDVLAVVEAKRKRKDVVAAIQQAKRYSEGYAVRADEALPGGPWATYRVPFLFATNGRAYLKQLEQKSGIWFLDARRKANHPRALPEWSTPAGLRELLRQSVDDAQEKLRTEPTDYLGLREYQISAIKSVEKSLEDGRRAALVAMATGTGKTRTFIGLIYRLIKANRFRRVLFLVDRSALGDQAIGAFKHAEVEGLQTFTQVYNIKELADLKPDPETKLHFATVQGMCQRILYAHDEGDRPKVDDYDCIVIDECHRGYTLDREMSDSELSFRDQDDYISKYRRVLEHFDAVRIGLTATPALHTTEIFGDPVFTYSYREAVIDGWLVDHEPPVRIRTDLSVDGIRWKRGAEVPAVNTKTQQLDLIHLPDELAFDIDAFNQRVITENFNRVVCTALAEQIDPSLDGKTLIFAANDQHADLVVRLLKDSLDARYGGVDDNAVVKITGAADKPGELLRRYKNERLPNFAVTVDLLTTGIDVPEIVNLVFLRRVKSRILYEQMLGRGTRLCPAIGKECFRIFDAVDLYSALEPFTSMKPVAANPTFTFAQLVDELRKIADEETQRQLLEQIVARLQRKRRHLEGPKREKAADLFASVAGMSAAECIAFLRKQSPASAAAWFAEHASVAGVIDRITGPGQYQYVSDHADALREVAHGYGEGQQRPEDYLEGFGRFLRENMNKLPALMVVTQRPRELTRRQLRELRLALDEAGYTEMALQAAWRDTTNEDTAASIIGFIRQRALGEPLVPYPERVDRAIKKLLAGRPWTPPQRKWLERIGQQLKVETVVDREALDRGQFEALGGFTQIDRTFGGKLEEILGDLTEALWTKAS